MNGGEITIQREAEGDMSESERGEGKERVIRFDNVCVYVCMYVSLYTRATQAAM